jgi:tetratricopeptide (TPR) repeat protein
LKSIRETASDLRESRGARVAVSGTQKAKIGLCQIMSPTSNIFPLPFVVRATPHSPVLQIMSDDNNKSNGSSVWQGLAVAGSVAVAGVLAYCTYAVVQEVQSILNISNLQSLSIHLIAFQEKAKEAAAAAAQQKKEAKSQASAAKAASKAATKAASKAEAASSAAAVEVAPKSPADLKREEGNAAFKAKDLERAIQLYTEAITLDSNNPNNYSNRGIAYKMSDKIEEAMADFSMAIQVKPDFAKGLFPFPLFVYRTFCLNTDFCCLTGFFQRALILKDAEEYEAALKDLFAAKLQNPSDAQIRAAIKEVEQLLIARHTEKEEDSVATPRPASPVAQAAESVAEQPSEAAAAPEAAAPAAEAVAPAAEAPVVEAVAVVEAAPAVEAAQPIEAVQPVEQVQAVEVVQSVSDISTASFPVSADSSVADLSASTASFVVVNHEPIAEPVVEAVAEPVVEAVAESVIAPVEEPVAVVSEPVVAAVEQAAAEKPAEAPAAEQPVEAEKSAQKKKKGKGAKDQQ